MPADLEFTADPSALEGADTLFVLGRVRRLGEDDVAQLVPCPQLQQMVNGIDPGDGGRVTSTWQAEPPTRVFVGLLPNPCSRHNSPARAWAIPRLIRTAPRRGRVAILAAVDSPEHALATAAGIARALPRYTATRASRRSYQVVVAILAPDGIVQNTARLDAVARGVRSAARLVDLPPNLLTTTAMVQEATALADAHPGVSKHVLRGDSLRQAGLGGLWAVGKAAEHPPALVVLDYDLGEGPRVGWVGKGIVYDTGGLSIKSKTSMVGMKNDMGGAAAVLGAFDAVARLGLPIRLTAVLCIAENAIGPASTRPDDVIRMYSGRTVEVNNTDAEGRLVLADGVAWVTRHRDLSELVDLATLTGAQSMATGKRQAALYCNDAELEARAVAAGRRTGDLVHPLPYVPEFFRAEFSSHIADMRNSVKDRSNAQSSCAGQFIGNHLGRYSGSWLHVDMAGPVVRSGRGTGFGAALLLGLVEG